MTQNRWLRLPGAVLLVTLVTACAAPLPPHSSADRSERADLLAPRSAGAPAPPQAPAAAGDAPGTAMPPYLIVQGDQVNLQSVADDGQYTIFSFRSPATGLQLFDQEGQSLPYSASGTVLGIQGVHKGVLLKRGAANSYVTPNPRARTDPKPRLDGDPQIAIVIRELDAQAIAMPAFKRALELADRAAPAQAIPVSASAPTPARPPAFERPDYTVADTPEGKVYRVFFASGGRAVVRPDDGLERIEQEAVRGRYIRVTGFTDSVGGVEANSVLARDRAQTIRHYLVRRGIDAMKIGVSWEANARYLAGNESVQGRALNRRAEVLIQPERTTTSDARR